MTPRKIRTVLAASAVLAAASPLTISPSGRVETAKACADGTCCAEDRSICFVNGIRANNAYYKGTGPCASEA